MVHAHPYEITLILVGPLTNVALAVSKDPSIVPLIHDIVIMGGSGSGGTSTVPLKRTSTTTLKRRKWCSPPDGPSPRSVWT